MAHTQISLLGGAMETAWSTPKESLIRKQQRKKSNMKSPQIIFQQFQGVPGTFSQI